MKTIFLKLMCLITLLGINTKSNAQYTLFYGGSNENDQVKEPYVFWDLMRDQTPSWIRYYRASENSPYGPSNRFIQKKDASGRFIHLENSLFNPDGNNWILANKCVFDRTMMGNKVSSEVKEMWVRQNIDGPILYRKTLLENTFENNKLTKAINEISSETGVMSYGETYFNYNELNQRYYDSSEINNTKYIDNYKFDNNNNCVFASTLIGSTQLANIGYKYTNNKLTETTYYSALTIDSPAYFKVTFAYNNQGLLTETVVSRESEGVLTPSNMYKHGYTEGGKLKWLSSYDFQNDDWLKLDSMVLEYTDNQIDTSYGYSANSTNEWMDYPNYMFVFNEQLVGIHSIEKDAIDFGVFPNPANDQVSINIDATDLINHVAITDILGKVVYQQNTYTKAIDVADLHPGIYFITLETNKGKGRKKIIIN